MKKATAAAASDPRQLRLVPAPDSEQKKTMKTNEADTFSDRKNVAMRCPYNKTELDHRLTLFRCKQGVNANKLFWRCEDCDDSKGKKGKLIGMDSELESDGLKTIDVSRSGASGAEKRKTISEDSIVASGRGVNWSQLASDVGVIREAVLELVSQGKRARKEADALERQLAGVGDIIKKAADDDDPRGACGELGNFLANISAAAVDHISESDPDEPAPPGPRIPWCGTGLIDPATLSEAARTAIDRKGQERDAEGGVRDGDSVQKPQS